MPPLDQSTIPPSGRTEAEIEAELESLSQVQLEQQLEQLDNPNADDKQPTAPKTKPEQSGEHDYEYEARRKGWMPLDKYTGPEGKWVDAKTFVERGERFTKKLEDKIAQLESKIAGFEGTKAQFRKFFDDQMAKRDREHAEAITALRMQHKAAIRDGDDALAIELEDRIDVTKAQQAALKKEAEAAAAEKTADMAKPAGDEPNPVLLEWIADGNDWFQKDEILTNHAVNVGKALRAAGDKSDGRVFLEKIKSQVMVDFPRRFKAADTAPKPTSTDGGGAGGTQSAAGRASHGKTERDLPPEDLALMKQFIKDGLYTKESFLASYFKRNG